MTRYQQMITRVLVSFSSLINALDLSCAWSRTADYYSNPLSSCLVHTLLCAPASLICVQLPGHYTFGRAVTSQSNEQTTCRVSAADTEVLLGCLTMLISQIYGSVCAPVIVVILPIWFSYTYTSMEMWYVSLLPPRTTQNEKKNNQKKW